MYNAYIPKGPPHEKIPEDHPPGFDKSYGAPSPSKGLKGLLDGLGLGKLDTGDLLLLLLLFLLLKEDDQGDMLLLLALAAVFLLDG
ncbi:MAG: hypothetical protein IJO37_04460 [Ruminiclostridium sp.]|nr:hypothetical protein [Ruminiclostridium sp.]